MTSLVTLGPWVADLTITSVRRLAFTRQTLGYIGWLGHANLGDDAMFEAAKGLFPDQNLEAFKGARREAMLGKFNLSGSQIFSSILLGGGTLINSEYMRIVRRALDFGVPMRSLGTGVGSSGFTGASEALPIDWVDLLGRFDRIGVRGPRSLDVLQELGIQNAEVIGDLALSLTHDASLLEPHARCFLLNVAAPKGTDPSFPRETVFTELADAAKRLMALGLEPIPVAFCKNDLDPLKAVMASAGITATIVRPRTAKAFFALARRARLSIGVRLHFAVLSVCAGLAPLTIAYRNKGKDFAASVGLEDWMVEPAVGGLAELAVALADTAPYVGAKAHSAALGWRDTLRRYVADV